MRIRFYRVVSFKWLVLIGVLLVAGCFQQPSAERLDYDEDTVQTLRQEIKSVDWDE